VSFTGEKKRNAMSIEASEYVVDEANARLLTLWLSAGQWTRRETTLLLLEIKPRSVTSECFSTFSGRGEVQYDYYDEDRKDKEPCSYHEDGEPEYLTDEQDALFHKTKQRCFEIDLQLNSRVTAEPHEWIDLACKKGIAIPWLDWAIARGLYGQKAEPEAVSKAVLNAPAVEVTVREPRPAATGPAYTMTKAAMIDQHKHEWPTIEQDIKDAARNGLNKAKGGVREWHEAMALEWARAKGRLTSNDNPMLALNNQVNSMFGIKTSVKHKLQG
jgi:hypothetical protein